MLSKGARGDEYESLTGPSMSPVRRQVVTWNKDDLYMAGTGSSGIQPNMNKNIGVMIYIFLKLLQKFCPALSVLKDCYHADHENPLV